LAGFIASYPNFAGICADRQAALATYGLSLDEGLKLEARVVRPALMSDELAAGLARFAAGARDASPRPPSDGAASAGASGDGRSRDLPQ